MNQINSTMFATKPPRHLFLHSAWDIIPITLGMAHFAFQIALFIFFPSLPWPALLFLGLFYSYCIAWNIESVAHNFTHIDYFKSKSLNRAFSLMLSLTIGFSQQFYKTVHRHHHIGNSDKPDANGNTRDWFSIYKHGKNARPESVWRYALLGPVRGPAVDVYASMGRGGREKDVRWAKFEDRAHYAWFLLGFILNWKFMLYYLPFYYLGHVFSMMVGYYEHYQANPDLPIAWGVSTYGKLYNFFWMNNGYHAEHHYRPRIHWTKMKKVRQALHDHDYASEIHVIKHSHLFGFLDATKVVPLPQALSSSIL